MNDLNCDKELRRLVPLRKVVGAVIIDLHEDFGRLEQVVSHHAVRGLKKLDQETLKSTPRKIILPVNASSGIAILPPDFDLEAGVYKIINGKKYPLVLRPEIVDSNIVVAECEDKCPRCNQSSSICNDLTITESVESILVNDQTSPPMYADKTVIKKLYPNGDYFLETTIPVWDIDTEQIIYTINKEFITAIDLTPCGCIEETESNLNKIKECAPDVWCCHWASCSDNCDTSLGGYNIFEESGIIKLDKWNNISQIYLEYWGFLAKRNGQWMVPKVSFETLVEWCKFKWLQNKRNIPRWERMDQFESYTRERSNMEKVMWSEQVSISMLMEKALSLPKFDFSDYV